MGERRSVASIWGLAEALRAGSGANWGGAAAGAISPTLALGTGSNYRQLLQEVQLKHCLQAAVLGGEGVVAGA